MKQSDCFNCHAIDQKIVGPPLLDVAAKYRGQPGAIDASVQRVMNGSTGVWGPVPMLPHPQHTADELHIMLSWVFGLEKGKGGPAVSRGLTGQIPVAKTDKPGTFVIEATYTDLGRPPAGNLSGKAAVTLRSRRIAVASGEVHGPRITGNGEQRRLGSIDHGHIVRFRDVDLSDVGSVTARFSSGNVGGEIELHAGSPTGDLLGSIHAPNTGGWDKWTEAQTELNTTDLHEREDVYVVFVNPGKSGLMNLDWLQFNPR